MWSFHTRGQDPRETPYTHSPSNAPAIHADCDLRRAQHAGERVTGELAAQVGAEDVRFAVAGRGWPPEDHTNEQKDGADGVQQRREKIMNIFLLQGREERLITLVQTFRPETERQGRMIAREARRAKYCSRECLEK